MVAHTPALLQSVKGKYYASGMGGRWPCESESCPKHIGLYLQAPVDAGADQLNQKSVAKVGVANNNYCMVIIEQKAEL